MFDIANSLRESFKTHDILSLWIIVTIIVATILWNFPKSRHKRYLYRIIVLGLLLGVLGTFFFLSFFSWRMLIFLLDWWIVLLAIAIYSATKPVFLETIPISHLNNLVREGRYMEIEKKYPKRPFYIISTSGKISWQLLTLRTLIEQESPRFRDAYKVCINLLRYSLFERERNSIRLKQVLVLLQLGDIPKAKYIFEQVKPKIYQTKYYEVLCLQSLFDEKEGEFEEARHNLLKAVGVYDDKRDIQLAMIYNNLGRMEKIRRNITNSSHYYRKSTELAGILKEKYLIHIVYQNIIFTYLMYAEKKNARVFFDEYASHIDKSNVDDLIKYNNFMLEFTRQIQDRALNLDTLDRGRIEILPKISRDRQLIFEISELRIRRNSQCSYDEKLFWVKDHLSEYLELAFPARYLALKEVFMILRELARTNNIGPFSNLFSQLIGFMGKSKKDIDRYILDLPDYCVYERCFWEKELAFLRKIPRPDKPIINQIDFYERMFEHLCNIKDIQLEHGNPLQAIEFDLNIADECMGMIPVIPEQSVKDYLLKKMQKHLDDACRDLEKFRQHPVSNEYVVRIARYALFLGDKGRAKEYFDEFIRSRIRINHYADWMQSYYMELGREFKF